jgi:DNA-3-methyladenine glycosylase
MLPEERYQRTFFTQPTLLVARHLLGQSLVRLEAPQKRLSGLIIETEAYIGQEDLGCHARAGRTKRNASMWGPPGHAYVYFTYGMHWMLNIVTEKKGVPAAVLLRGIWPQEGIESMRERRHGRPLGDLTNGPAKLCQALAIDRDLDGHDLCTPHSRIFVARRETISPKLVTSGPRVGLNNVPEPWKSIPWRFRLDPRSLQ